MLRRDFAEMIALAERLLEAGEHGIVATLLAASGSTYRPRGSMMVSAFPTQIAGGVSGGCLEPYVVREGRMLTQSREAVVMRFDTDPDSEDPVRPTLGCGGEIQVLVERLTRGHVEFLRRVEMALKADEPSRAACVVRCGADGLIRVERTWLGSGAAASGEAARFCEMTAAGGDAAKGEAGTSVLIHEFEAMPRLVIFGAGDDVQPVCGLARSLEWHVTVADRRGRLATAERFPEAEAVVAVEWAEALRAIRLTASTAVVLMTHSLPDDLELLRLLERMLVGSIGVLGPAHRKGWLIGMLREQGVGAEFLASIRGPVGLDLGDRSAAGIAVSIMAELAAMRHGRDGRPRSREAADSGVLWRGGACPAHV